jgi:hypothetical protein
MGAFDSTVKAIINKANTRIDIAPFPSSLTPLHQWWHVDNADSSSSAQTVWPAPFDSSKAIRLLDMIFSTDTAVSVALYQALLADYVTQITTDGALHLWKLDEASGSALDPIGSKTLTAVGAPTYAAESWVCGDGKSVSFNGTSDGFTTATKVASSSAGALEAWVWMNTNAGSTKIYMAAGDEAGANDYIRASLLTTFLPNFIIHATSGSYIQNATAKYQVANRTWTHIVWQGDHSSIECYINGRQVPLTIGNSPTGWYDNIQSVVDNFTLGFFKINASSSWHNGKLTCAAWYNAKKSADVWRTHYEMGAPLFGPHYFPANGGIAQPQRTPVTAQAGRPVLIRTSAFTHSSMELYGYES